MSNQDAIQVAGQEVAETTSVAKQGGVIDFFGGIVPMIAIFAIIYFFMIRPQVKKQKEQQSLIESAKKGDKVIAAGGLVGKIVKVKESDMLMLEISKDVQIEILRSSIISIIDDKKKK